MIGLKKKRMKFKLILVLVFFAVINIQAQQGNKNANRVGCHIEIKAPGQEGKYIHLAKYNQGNVYTVDSIMLTQQSQAIFNFENKLPVGQYLLYIRPHVQIEILLGVDQQNVRIKLDAENLSNSKVEGSLDTELFWSYIAQMNVLNERIQKINELLGKSEDIAHANKLEKERNNAEQEILKYMRSQTKEYENEWFGAFLKGSMPIEYFADAPGVDAQYIRSHYFDNISFTDSRLWNTNYFPQKIDDYLYRVLPQIPDTVAYEASRLVAKTRTDSICFKETLSWILNNSVKSNYMGMENVWAKLAEDYIVGNDISWISKEQAANIRSLYEALKYNRIGMKAHNLRMATIEGDTINTNEIQAEYTVLYFYNPTCGHCAHTTPLLRDNIYKKYKNKNLRIVAIDIDANYDAWKNYITTNNLSEWINCSDPNYKSAYWMYYDTSAVPMIYVLDKNKRIIARKIDSENLEKLLNHYMNR